MSLDHSVNHCFDCSNSLKCCFTPTLSSFKAVSIWTLKQSRQRNFKSCYWDNGWLKRQTGVRTQPNKARYEYIAANIQLPHTTYDQMGVTATTRKHTASILQQKYKYLTRPNIGNILSKIKQNANCKLHTILASS